jgi:hypothetical protein
VRLPTCGNLPCVDPCTWGEFVIEGPRNGDPLADGEPRPGAVRFGVRDEGLEQSGGDLWRDARPAIGQFGDQLGWLDLQAQADLASLQQGIRRILDEVEPYPTPWPAIMSIAPPPPPARSPA